MQINHNYNNLEQSYLFSTIAKKVNEYKQNNPDKNIIRLGIGDVTLPLAPAVISAMHKAVDDMADASTFKGYGEEQGYLFLRQAIANYYAKKGVELTTDEVFISDGAKSDVGNILDLFDKDNIVLIPDPVYPVYVDTNIMDGRQINYIKGTQENNFLPMPDDSIKADIIYLCSPNNPTGSVYTKAQLKTWVDYALKNDAVILFDSAYEIFVTDTTLPTSIYQIEGAKKCAIEFCSLSKTAGFTGTRCGYTIVPTDLVKDGNELRKMWLRRQSTKFNGVSYIVQRGAEAVFSDEGMAQIKEQIAYYLNNAKTIADGLRANNIWFVGGENSPYIWLKCPNNMSSWEYFDFLLNNANVVGTPGAGFGDAGEGYFRLSAFGDAENVKEAVKRIIRG
ncbi:MAG: LL-diaminopimelate aminotransferase [Clostridiales bacterium]|jgi:LL-diaminopimelate aminotransferase|nr:LL-diaminopimelate aminotransferase [Clostridiales bacterium]